MELAGAAPRQIKSEADVNLTACSANGDGNLT